MKTNVAIFGLGLIGGSLGLALKRNDTIHVTGFDRSYATADEAYRRGIIDTIAPSAQAAWENADFIIFATPVNTTIALMREAATWNLKMMSFFRIREARKCQSWMRPHYCLTEELRSLADIRWRAPIKAAFPPQKSICLKMPIIF